MHLVFPHLQVKRTSSSEYGYMHVLTNVFYNNPLLRDQGVFSGGGGGGHGKVKMLLQDAKRSWRESE